VISARKPSRKLRRLALLLAGAGLLAWRAEACDLCAIYSAANARGEAVRGFVFTVAEQYVPENTLQFEGREFTLADADYVNSSLTHLVPGYNFSARFGISFNLPVVHRAFKRTELRYGSGPTQFRIEEGNLSGLGDASLIARWTALMVAKMEYAVIVNLLAGVKFPTGDSDRIADAVEQVRAYEAIVGPGHNHDALGTPISGVHQHDLAPGSGSCDGVFGLTLHARRGRWFLNAQAQYYLRTPGREGYEFGDEVMVNGGPGVFVLLRDEFTLNLQFNAAYESMARDRIQGRKSNHTGMTAWYAGPTLNFTRGEHFSLNAGVDIPLRIENNGYQNVPDYRFHGGLTVRF
jgi:hypothetical protein